MRNGNLLQVVASSCVCVFLAAHVAADGPKDNDPLSVRQIPPVGQVVDPKVREQILERAGAIRHQVATLKLDAISYDLIAVIPRAVEISLETNMIYAEKDLRDINDLLTLGETRLGLASEGVRGAALLGHQLDQAESQLVVGGFRSRLDGSLQPFGLVIPAGWNATAPPSRLDVWLHGRGERTSEAAFMMQRLRRASEYTPANTLVLHPYGRYSNAFKFAGEVDVLEAIECTQRLFEVDSQRIAIRGFSMGGAGCWQMAVHYPNLFAAANPGAGFSETTQFLKEFQEEDFKPTWYQSKLLHWYDCPDWTNNLRNVPTIAYSGELDRQKQAADVMERSYAERGMQLPHVIGPGIGHKIHPESKNEIQDWLTRSLDEGKSPVLRKVDLTTYMLRYHQLGWLSIERMGQHWQEARVQAEIVGSTIQLTTKNVDALRLDLPANSLIPGNESVEVVIDGERIQLRTLEGGQLQCEFKRSEQQWRLSTLATSETSLISVKSVGHESKRLSKRPGLTGPIDDAFMDPFLFIGPQATQAPSAVEVWVQQEFERAKHEWRRHFRGDIVEKESSQLSADDIKDRNLVLFGTPRTNPLIQKVLGQLPLKWSESALSVGSSSYASDRHVPVLIYPNPLNPERYVVINSGFTYREYAYLNNARQIPMLPDWAVVDVTDGPTTQFPGHVVNAGFFDEDWQFAR